MYHETDTGSGQPVALGRGTAVNECHSSCLRPEALAPHRRRSLRTGGGLSIAMKTTTHLGFLLIVLSLAFAPRVGARDSLPVTWDMKALLKPPAIHAAPAQAPVPDGVSALCFEGLPFQRKPTRIFAYYAVPVSATADKPAPGIVLVHGAGGTAFADWVKLWVDRGYAAIAFDHDGGIPVGKYSNWERNPDGAGPKRAGFNDVVTRPVPDHYMYHAVADTILAHSLLRSLPGVDADRIGITGISLGGVVGSVAVGVDHRFKFFAPVYGCGFISENDDDGSRFIDSKLPWMETEHRATTWNRLWDPQHYLPRSRLPILWVNGTNDFAFTLKAWQRSYRVAPGTVALSLRVRMKHGHGGAGENPDEIRAFAEHVVNGGASLLRVGAQGREGDAAWVAYDSPRALVRAELNFSRASGRWQDRLWETAPATVSGGRVSAALPADATAWFFNLIDDRGLIVSSEHVERGI